MNDHRLMSARTIPVIETAIRVSRAQENWANNVQFSYARDPEKEEAGRAAALKASQAFWIDALCVPPRDPSRTACLQSMGEIFNSASQVFAVLAEVCSEMLHQMHNFGRLDHSALFILESDEWITRAWTYQETVNSKAMYFMAENNEITLISGLDFLNAVLTATDDYRNAHEMDSFAWSEQHPKLDSLIELVADYRIAEYTARSAYQVMSAMHRRVSERAEDHFYAMTGAITTSSQESQIDDSHGGDSIRASEYFMRICEGKNDYSFIYSIAPRSVIPGRHWRPVEGRFPPVLPGLLVSGEKLRGTIELTHLQLENMYRLAPGGISEDGLKAARWYLQRDCSGLSLDDIASAILECIRKKGFSGCGERLELENGFFFPQSNLARFDDIFIALAIDVQGTNASPALLLRSNGTDINDFCDVGAFIGRIPKLGYSIKVG